MGIIQYLTGRYRANKVKRKVEAEVPSLVEQLKKKYNFSEATKINSNGDSCGGSGDAHVLDENRAGKILKRGGFEDLRDEYISQRVSNKLGLPVLQSYELVLARNNDTGERSPMLVMEYGGGERLSDMIRDEEMSGKFQDAEKKVKSYFRFNVPDFMRGIKGDIGAHNAFWNRLERKVTLFDCGYWKF